MTISKCNCPCCQKYGPGSIWRQDRFPPLDEAALQKLMQEINEKKPDPDETIAWEIAEQFFGAKEFKGPMFNADWLANEKTMLAHAIHKVLIERGRK